MSLFIERYSVAAVLGPAGDGRYDDCRADQVGSVIAQYEAWPPPAFLRALHGTQLSIINMPPLYYFVHIVVPF
jgi:hypothetical protein